jgi:Transposase DDE domain
MSNSHELYHRLVHAVHPLVSVSHIQQLANWMWIVVGILQADSMALSKIAMFIPGEAEAESRVTTIRRWLKNLHVDVWELYRPILEHVLPEWHPFEVTIVLDGVMVFSDRLQIFRLSLVHGYRAIPLVWKVIPGKGLTQAQVLEMMLTQAADFLRPRVKRVRFLADRGFRDCDWADWCVKLGWHYDIRIQCNTTLTLENGWHGRVDALGVKPGQRRYFQNVRLTQAQKWRAHLSVTWTEGDDKNPPELLAVISDEWAGRARLCEYGVRMDIEQSFRDDKSAGFDMAHTRLQHPDRLERLLLAVAIATLWCHELGEFVLNQGETCRREIDPGPKRELSIFQLGLRWLKRCVATAIQRLPLFNACLTPIRLAPVIKRVSLNL